MVIKYPDLVLLQLCIMAAVASAMRGDQILYFDTSASFSGRRVATVYDELHLRMQVIHSICINQLTSTRFTVWVRSQSICFYNRPVAYCKTDSFDGKACLYHEIRHN